MKKLPILFLLMFVGGALSASDLKKKDPFLLRLDSITHLLRAYDTLSPFNDLEYELIDSLQGEITGRLLSVLNDKRILNYDIEKMWIDRLGMAISSDKRVWFFTLDGKNGGSWRMVISIFHCRPKNGNVLAFLDGNIDQGETAFDYSFIYPVDSVKQKYLAIGSVVTCNTCQSLTAVVITLDSSYSIETLYAQDSRFDDKDVFDYNDSAKIFSYAYAYRSNDPMYGNNETVGGTMPFIHHYKGRFQYLDGTFIQIEKIELIEPVKQ